MRKSVASSADSRTIKAVCLVFLRFFTRPAITKYHPDAHNSLRATDVRTQELHLDHALPCRAPEEPEEFDPPDVRKLAVLTETIRRLRNENWHLLCEMDLLKLALQSQKNNYPQQTPAYITNYNKLQCMADQQLEEMSARCRASKFLVVFAYAPIMPAMTESGRAPFVVQVRKRS